MTLSRSVKWIIAVVIALLVYWGIDVPTDLADPKTPLFLAITVGTVVVWAFELMPAAAAGVGMLFLYALVRRSAKSSVCHVQHFSAVDHIFFVNHCRCHAQFWIGQENRLAQHAVAGIILFKNNDRPDAFRLCRRPAGSCPARPCRNIHGHRPRPGGRA